MPDRESLATQLACGTWHVVRSSLPMWRRSAGTISYCPLPDGSVGDVVTTRRNGRIRHIVGIDRMSPSRDWDWEWRGVEPLTLLVRSRWCFVGGRDGAGWAATLFEKTVFSAAGIDIYCRRPIIDAAALTDAIEACTRHPRAARHVPALFEPPVW